MFRRFSVNFAIFSIFTDCLVVMVSLQAASLIRPTLNQFEFARIVKSGYQVPWQLLPLFTMVWIFVLLVFSIYDGRKYIRVVDEFSMLTLGSALASVASAGLLYLTFRDVSRLLFLTFVIFTYFGLVCWRAIYRIIVRWGGFAPDHRRVLIVGAGELGQKAYQQVQLHSQFGLTFCGFLDDESSDVNVVGYLDDARNVIAEKTIDDVVVAMPGRAYQRVNQLIAEMHDLPVRVWVIPDYFSLVLHQARVEEYAGIPMLNLRAPALNDYQRLTKRVFDLLITVLLLPILLPVIGIISLAIKLSDKGPALFIQKRVGENGKLFNVYKFRTMVTDAEKYKDEVEKFDEKGNLIHKRPDDPRVTKIGKILRRASLDELPNFFNVLKGDMSLIGPRPELPYLVENYEDWQRKRFAMPPGITGWWQVTGRSDKPMHLNTEDDLYYVQHYSIWLDLLILWKTIWVVINGKGAY
jgi:exopolysaccharide biosynthesis polyprenyl glycosylphosphotransferase